MPKPIKSNAEMFQEACMSKNGDGALLDESDFGRPAACVSPAAYLKLDASR